MINQFRNVYYKRHFHSSYSFSLILEGRCHIDIEDKSYKITEGMVRVINPYEIHEIKPSSWKHKNLILEKETIKEILDEEPLFENVIKDEFLNVLLEKIDLKEFLEYLYLNYKKAENTLASLHVKRLKKAKRYIEKNIYKSDINIENLASYVGFSKYHFIREFKKEFGLTPYHYIHNLKINNARELLKKGESLSQVAQLCGFTDQSHFIKIYKKFYGHTPSKVSNNLLY